MLASNSKCINVIIQKRTYGLFVSSNGDDSIDLSASWLTIVGRYQDM